MTKPTYLLQMHFSYLAICLLIITIKLGFPCRTNKSHCIVIAMHCLTKEKHSAFRLQCVHVTEQFHRFRRTREYKLLLSLSPNEKVLFCNSHVNGLSLWFSSLDTKFLRFKLRMCGIIDSCSKSSGRLNKK